MRSLLNLMHPLGNSSITRRSLVMQLFIETPHLLKGFARALGRFTSFRVVELHLHERYKFDKDLPEWCEYLKTALEPMFGYAEEYKIDRSLDRWNTSGKNLRFHPVDHQNHSDCDYLDGIRLSWNETLTDTDDSGKLTQKQERKYGSQLIRD